jgi:SAM-dependent methyltransferase
MIVQTLHGRYTRIDWIGTFSGFKGKGIARWLIGNALEEANSTGSEVFIKVQSPYKLRFDHLGFETFEEIEYFTFRSIYPTSIEALPEHVPYNGVLRSKLEFQERMAQLEMLDLPMHGDLPKNWDSYAALDIILRHSGDDRKDVNILDAGGESYSPILYQLEACGFRNLKCINLSLEGIEGVKNITYEYGDITATRFEDGEFDFVVCLSVIEHGVDAERYFREMHRILRKGGLLITSTDYWATPVDTSGRVAYNTGMKIFDAAEILRVADLAKAAGFRLKAELELDCDEKTVSWLGVDYTFLYFTLEKIDS